MNTSQDPVGTALPSLVIADVDGTVIKTDLLYEALLAAVKRKPLIVFLVPFWLLAGRAVLKRRLAESAQLSLDHIPLRESVVSYLRERAADGARVVFASASDSSLVVALGERLGFISDVIASDGAVNCKGAAKAAAIEARFPGERWEYLGDSRADLDVWPQAACVTCVGTSPRLIADVLNAYPNAHIIPGEPVTLKVLLRALRVYQWMKNLLVFIPLILAHHLLDVGAWKGALIAAMAFSLCASGVYVLNDLLDLEADRAHPRKRFRPCASGRLPLQRALLAVPLLFVCAFALAFQESVEFVGVLGLYLFLTSAYSFRLKAIALIDIILLAILYTIRIIGGGIASHIEVSQWLLGVSMFFFLSLACVKRFSELLIVLGRRERQTKGRGYSVEDLEQIAIFGSTSGYMAVLVLALYISSREVTELYSRPGMIWLACPLLLYWVSRTWLLARRGVIHDDPLIFALTDKVTYAVGACAVLIFLAAR